MTKVTETYLLDCGYSYVRELPSGVWLGLQRMAYTTGLFVGLDETGYEHRYCYEYSVAALHALLHWDGEGDPPGPWIKQKGARGGDRLNPRLKDDDFV